jgi:hypothetical protein
MQHIHRLRLAGLLAALSIVAVLAACGGGNGPDPVLASITVDAPGSVTAWPTRRST